MVSAIKLPFLWLDMFKFLCNKLYFIVFFTREENLSNFRKFSQQMEHTRAKWTPYHGHMATAKREHNIITKLFITQTAFGGPLQFELSSFIVYVLASRVVSCYELNITIQAAPPKPASKDHRSCNELYRSLTTAVSSQIRLREVQLYPRSVSAKSE